MKFLNKLEKKYGKYAIQNLTLFLIIGYVVGYIIRMVNTDLLNMLTLNPHLIMQGQIWRLVTWVIMPPSSLSIFTIIMLFFYYSLGTSLEHTWGPFKYNVYIFSGILFTIISAIIIYFAFPADALATEFNGISGSDLTAYSEAYHQSLYDIKGYVIGQYVSTYYINLSIFLLFAALFPDMQVMLYFIIPVKIKWLAYLDVALILYEMYYMGWIGRIIVLVSLLNFILFFMIIRSARGKTFKNKKRQSDYQKKVYKAKNLYEGGARHKCAICGRTELDDPSLTFRFCSKCTGGREYCNDHLFSHEHV